MTITTERGRSWPVEEAWTLHLQGWSLRKLGARYDRSPTAVALAFQQKYPKEYGKTPPPRLLPWSCEPVYNTTVGLRLRTLIKINTGQPVKDYERSKLKAWLPKNPKGFVVSYDPGDEDWVWRRRVPWERDGIEILHGLIAVHPVAKYIDTASVEEP